MRVELKDLPAAIGGECAEALALAKRLAEIHRLCEACYDKQTGQAIRGIELEIKLEYYELQDDFRVAMFNLMSLFEMLESQVVGLVIYREPEPEPYKLRG